jgi:hypothetical protein
MSWFSRILDEEMRAGNVAHAHDSAGFVHFHLDEITANQSFLVIDLSDTDFYTHSEKYSIHLDQIFYRIDADSNASYRVRLWAVDNLTNDDCTRTMVWSESGTRSTGVNIGDILPMNPYGPVLRDGRIASTMIENNYTGYNLLTPLSSTKDTTVSNVIPGDGDMVIEFIFNNNNPIEPHFIFTYHTHSEFHP